MTMFIEKSVSDFISVIEDLTRSVNGDFLEVCNKDIFFNNLHQ